MVGNQIKFDDQVVALFLTNIYKQRFNIDSDIEAEMFRATRRIMADAMATGIADAVDNGTPMPSETFLNNLRHSAEVFSAFRVHKMQTDVASQMVDANGKLKTFAQFRKDVEPYVSHRNRAWLRTEYDTAVIRAHQATDWQQFESEKDVFPNLEWIPSTSPHPGADHQVFWGTVRPVNDSFWSEHRPGDRWNCKCELRQTEADATIPPMPTDADNPQPGLENNPGRDGELFSQKHPYYPSGCMSCPFAGGHLAALMHGLAHKQDCHQCEKVNKVITKIIGEVKSLRDVAPPHVATYMTSKHSKRVFISPLYGQTERTENERLAAFVAKKMQQKVYILPLLDPDSKTFAPLREKLLPPGVPDRKNPDFYIGGLLFDGKSMLRVKQTTNKKKHHNDILNRIKDAKKQADNMILEIPTFITRRVISETIKGYLSQSNKSRIIIVKHGEKCYVYKQNRGN